MKNYPEYASESEKTDIFLFDVLWYSSLAVILAATLYTVLESGNLRLIVVCTLLFLPVVTARIMVAGRRNFETWYFILCLCLSLFDLPVGFLISGGFVSGIPVFFPPVAIACAFCRRRIHGILAIGTEAAVILLLFFLEPALSPFMLPFDRSIVRWDILISVIVVTAIILIFVGRIWKMYRQLADEKLRMVNYKNQMFREMLEKETEAGASLRSFRHDARHRRAVLTELLESGEYGKALECLREFDGQESGKISGSSYCLNLTLNSILNYMNRRCQKKGIIFTVFADVNEKICISSGDLCTIASNLLENAINGAEESGHINPSVSFRAVTNGNRLVMTCENTCIPDIQIRNGMLQACSTGIAGIVMALKPYDGTILYSREEGPALKCTVLLNLPPADQITNR